MQNQQQQVMVIFGTRPECIKMAPVVHALRAHDALEPVVVNSSQHKDLLQPFLGTFDLSVDRDLDIMKASQTPSTVLAAALERLDAVLGEYQPDMVLVQGDTTTALAGALAAFHCRIPVGHVEAGLRTGNMLSPFPEEMNRKVIGTLASLHFAATQDNVDNLAAESVDDDRVVLCGNTVVDSVHYILDRHEPSPAIRRIVDGAAGRRLVLMTTHRRESFGTVMAENLEAIGRFLAANDDVEIVFPVHPNPNVREAVATHLHGGDRLHIIDPLGYGDFITLMRHSAFLVSDSGGVQEEAACLGKKLIVLRENTERPEVVRAGIAKLIGHDTALLESLLSTIHEDAAWDAATEANRDLYGDGTAGIRIADAVARFFDRARSSGSASR